MTSDVTIGEGTYLGPHLSVPRWCPGERVEIGAYCSIADRVELFCGGGHRTSLVSTFPFDPRFRGTTDAASRTYKHAKPTRIGNDVWIASGACIMPGLTIGNGAVIGPHAVVFGSVEPYAVMRGNPAVRVRYRFEPAIIDALQRIAWWDWPAGVVESRVDDFYLPVAEFVAKYDTRSAGMTAGVQPWGDHDHR